jgi:hypothetical protein
MCKVVGIRKIYVISYKVFAYSGEFEIIGIIIGPLPNYAPPKALPTCYGHLAYPARYTTLLITRQ